MRNYIYINIIIFIAILGFTPNQSIANEAYPGENLINDESLLKARLESMNTIFDANYSSEFRQRLGFILKTNVEHIKPMLGRMVMYFPQIDSILEANDLPTDLKYVTYIESSLNPYAKSRAGAVGMWQFMSGTAKMMGIRINKVVDERKDPYASTHAAVKYFKYLYEIYGDWGLVLQAYNSGPGRVNRAIDKAGTSDFNAIQQYLPKETREYVPKFLAAAFFFKHYQEFDLEPEWPHLDLQITSRKLINKRLTFKQIEQFADFLEGHIQILNPSYSRKFIPRSKKGYHLVLPKRFESVFDSLMLEDLGESINRNSIESETLELTDVETAEFLDPYYRIKYRVKSGQTLKKIAELTNSDLYHLRYWNEKNSDKIMAGEYINVYMPKSDENFEQLSLIFQPYVELINKLNIQNFKLTDTQINVNDFELDSKLSLSSNDDDDSIEINQIDNAIYLLDNVFSF